MRGWTKLDLDLSTNERNNALVGNSFGVNYFGISLTIVNTFMNYKGERLKQYPDKANHQMTTANTKWKLEGDYFEGCIVIRYVLVYLREIPTKAFVI
jgi:hypothetical protein